MNFTVPDISKWIAQPDTAILWLQQNYLITWGVILGVSYWQLKHPIARALIVTFGLAALVWLAYQTIWPYFFK